MTRRRQSVFDQERSAAPLATLVDWAASMEGQMLRLLWRALDRMREDGFVGLRLPDVEEEMERELTTKLFSRLQQCWAADGGGQPFHPQSGYAETETRRGGNASPPVYDVAFVFTQAEYLAWPVEAKVLGSPSSLGDYTKTIRERFLTCRYAPFTSGGAMLGFLSGGEPASVFGEVTRQTGYTLDPVVGFDADAHRASQHAREVPTGKPYSSHLRLHHLVFRWR